MLLILPFLPNADGGLDPVRFPVDAAHCVDPQRHLFHDDVVGGYLIYAHAEIRVFVDDRAELYGEDLFRDVLEVRSGGSRMSEVLTAYDVEQVLLAADAPGVSDLVSGPWNQRYQDENWVLFDSKAGASCG